MPTAPTPAIKLLPFQVDKEIIPKARYNTDLPEYIRSIANNYPHATKVTITPKREAGPGVCRTIIVAGASNKCGPVIIENLGRVPRQDPAPGLDDLRPVVWLGFGTGKQNFKVVLQSDPTNNYLPGSVTFE